MFRCGFYESEITPFLGGMIPGYYHERFADGVKSKLYVKALAVGTDEKEMVIIAIDGIHTSPELCEGIYQRVAQFAGLFEEQIMVAATHNHTAGSYVDYPDIHVKDELYTQFLIRRSADCAVLARQRMEEATVSYGCDKVPGMAFIRNYRMKDGTIRTNPGNMNPNIVEPIGAPDEDFPFLLFRNAQGKLIGSLSSFSLHHDTVAGTSYCADYSGILSDELKRVCGNDFVSVFLSGFCGNVNHSNTQLPAKLWYRPTHVKVGKALFTTMWKHADWAKKIEEPTIGYVKRHLAVEQRKVDPKELEEAKSLMKKSGYDYTKININAPDSELFKRAKAPGLIEHADSQDQPAEVTIQAMNIGDCVIYAANGELYVEFQHYIKEHAPTNRNMFSSLSNGAFRGYVPTKEMYEVKTLYEAQLPSARLVQGTGERLAEELVEMAEELLG